MSNIIGYARVSTLEQNAALQVDALTAGERGPGVHRPRLRCHRRPARSP